MATSYGTFYWPGSGGSGQAVGAANSVALGSGVSSASAVFTNAFGSTSYVPFWSITNLIDASPIFLDGYISAMSGTGFTVTFNAPTDSANYIFNYGILDYA